MTKTDDVSEWFDCVNRTKDPAEDDVESDSTKEVEYVSDEVSY